MIALITPLLTLLEQLLPSILSAGNVTIVDSVINILTAMLPQIVDEINTVAPAIKNIIAALSADPNTTAVQLTQLQALDAQVDTAFEAAAKDTDDGI